MKVDKVRFPVNFERLENVRQNIIYSAGLWFWLSACMHMYTVCMH